MSTRSSRRAKRVAQNDKTRNQNAPQPTAPLDASDSTAAASASSTSAASSSASSAANALASPNLSADAAASNRQNDAAPSVASSVSTSQTPTSSKRPARPTVSPKSDARGSYAPRTTVRGKNTRAVQGVAATTSGEALGENDLSLRVWRALAWTILVVAAALRLWQLDFVPFHHDEGVNGQFINPLFYKGEYKYNPTNFHGPTLYYFALVTSYFNTFFLGKLGFNEIALRLVPALFGIGVIVLVLRLRRHLGTGAILCAAALLAFSPGMVFVSRYFIHEMQFLFFTLLAVVAMLNVRPRGAWWWPAVVSLFVAGLFSLHGISVWMQSHGVDSLTVTEMQFLLLSLGFCVALMRARPLGNHNWAFVAALALALLFGSKETAPISMVILLFSAFLTWFVCDRLRPRKLATSNTGSDIENTSGGSLSDDSGDGERRDWRLIGVALGAMYLFWIVIAVFFSSFSRAYFGEGMNNFFSAYGEWRKTGESDFQAKPLLTYLVWMLTIEPTVFVLGCAGIWISLWQRTNRFAVFVAFWAIGIFTAYSLIPYKTPWLMINFVLPFALMSGVALQQCGAWLGRFADHPNASERISSTRYTPRGTWRTAAVLAPFLLLSIWQMSDLNFFNYDNDDAVRNLKGNDIQLPKWTITRGDKKVDLLPGDIKKYPYVYVHTQRGYLKLMREIDKYAQRSGLGYKAPIAVTSDEYWPMPWSLRNYGVGFYGRIMSPSNEIMIIGRVSDDAKYNQDPQLQALIGNRYVRVGQYNMRPSVILSLWVRRDLAD